MIKPMQGCARSVFHGDEAADFVQWVSNAWSALTPEQRKTATMQCRPIEKDGFAMIGFDWDFEPEGNSR